jgi:hypothetical protein
MAGEGRGAAIAAGEIRAGPYVGVAQLTATPEPERLEPEPDAKIRWVLPIGRYVRTVTSEFQGARYG